MTQGELGKMAYDEFMAHDGRLLLGTLIPRAWEELDSLAQSAWMMAATKVCIETQRELALQGRLPNG